MAAINSKHDLGSGLYLLGACLVAALGGLLFGFDTAVINGAIEQVQLQFGLDDWMKGIVASAAVFACLFGAAIAGTLSDRFGRKKVLLVAAVLFAVSALASAVPRGAWELFAARFIGGMGIGIASMLSPLYIAEISPPRRRGALVAMYQLAITVGILGAFLSNYALSSLAEGLGAEAVAGSTGGLWRWMFVDEVWRAMFLAGLAPAVVLFLAIFLVPESPRWLTQQGRTDEALVILTRVNGPEEANRALGEIRETLAQESGSLGQLFERGLRLALVIGLVLPFLSQVSGINVIIYYGVTVFKAAGYAENAGLLSQVVFGVVNMVFTLVAILTVDKFGRRPLLLVGITGVGAMLFVAGRLFSLDPIPGGWLLVTFACYLACFAFSYGPVCWIIIAEIFPTRVRGRAMSIATFSLWSGCNVVALTFPALLRELGPTWTFWLYGLTTPIALVFVWFLVPETKGQTLEQIERHWGH